MVTLPWFNWFSLPSLSLVAPAWAEMDGTLTANNCDGDGKTLMGSCLTMTTKI